ncbi:zinc finger protein 623-like [Rhagoletis pomonella]|uniref:zinc finger protein 623-like n=1 Tax=Rhagoletis pomonella TaxID=28610 RepID=UPI00177F3E4D|nr:zinc finger protein 623-like [Rhagoletis pomonella]XP_036341515.1 zinc finger protein 623-like [Rhagoletis pomonella]
MDIVPICRVCLKTSLSYIDLETPFEQSNPESFHLETHQSSMFTTYMDCFRTCTQLAAADREEEMPQSICEQCGFELDVAWNFIKKSVYADTILKGSLESKENVSIVLLGDFEEYETEFEVADEEVLSSVSDDKNVVTTLKEEEDGNDNITTQETENQALMVLCLHCGSYFNPKFEHSHNTSSPILSIKLIEEDSLNRNLNIDYSENNEKDNDSLNETITNESAPLIEAEKHSILELMDVGIDGGNITHESFEEDDVNTEKIIIDDNEIDLNSAFYCSTCLQSFETRRKLLLHSRTHKAFDGKASICKICHQKVTKGETIRQHIKNNHSKIIQCSECEYRCLEVKMEDHVRRTHDNSITYPCNFCDKTFFSQTLLNTHHKYHQRKEVSVKSDACQICGKRFSTQHYLRLHCDVHRNERQLHQCDYCDKVYVSKVALENHIRLHKGDTINCDQCGKQFVRQYELNVHMRFHTREYPFECEVCGKKFAIKGHLRTHMWRHQGLKLQCEECGKLFTSTKALQEHSFVHSEMPFPCSYCGRGYPSKQKFKVHLKSTHLIDLTEEELLKVTKLQTPKPLHRKKLTLVQADSVMKEIEVKDSGGDVANDIEEMLVKLN